jgi:long-chain acyl-CoA synthetase
MLLAGPLSVASGLLTPTLKVRRATLTERYAAEIAALYEAEPAEAPPSPVLPPASA